MGKFKGTQGVWDTVEINITDYKQLAIVSDKKVIAHVYLPDYKIEEDHAANAKLIAAAPKMLEIINELVSAIINEDIIIKSNTEEDLNGNYFYKKALEVLKKATE